MNSSVRISTKAAAAFCFGTLSLFSGFLALLSDSDGFLVGVPVFFVLAVILGILGRREIKRQPGRFADKALAGWGMAIPVGGVCLGFFLLPAV